VTISRLRRRAAARLALAAMVLNVSWPLLANAKPADPAAEICSATGLKHSPGTPEKGFHASHCNLCPFGAERGVAIPLAGARLLASAALAPTLARSESLPLAIPLYPAAPPRAPPFLS
jgi:hypothetical protein